MHRTHADGNENGSTPIEQSASPSDPVAAARAARRAQVARRVSLVVVGGSLVVFAAAMIRVGVKAPEHTGSVGWPVLLCLVCGIVFGGWRTKVLRDFGRRIGVDYTSTGALAAVVLTMATLLLFAAGAARIEQENAGRPEVDVTVTSCHEGAHGDVGCDGTWVVDGERYEGPVPDVRESGITVQRRVDLDDPKDLVDRSLIELVNAFAVPILLLLATLSKGARWYRTGRRISHEIDGALARTPGM